MTSFAKSRGHDCNAHSLFIISHQGKGVLVCVPRNIAASFRKPDTPPTSAHVREARLVCLLCLALGAVELSTTPFNPRRSLPAAAAHTVSDDSLRAGLGESYRVKRTPDPERSREAGRHVRSMLDEWVDTSSPEERRRLKSPATVEELKATVPPPLAAFVQALFNDQSALERPDALLLSALAAAQAAARAPSLPQYCTTHMSELLHLPHRHGEL